MTEPAAQLAELTKRAIRHHQAGELAEAEDCYRRILAVNKTHFDGLHLLGVLAQQTGRSNLAADLIGQAIALHEREGRSANGESLLHSSTRSATQSVGARDLAIANSNLSIALMAKGEPVRALQAIQRSLQLAETENTKLLFVQCLRDVNFIPAEIDVRDSLIRALSDPWGRPLDLAKFAANLLKRDGAISACIRRAKTVLPRHAPRELCSPSELDEICGDRLLYAVLEQAPLWDVELERLLTAIRQTLLESVRAAANQFTTRRLSLFCALAQQCFTNEYIFDCTPQEQELVNRLATSLSDAIASAAPIPEAVLVAVAAYLPLASIPAADALLRRSWSAPVAALVKRQIQEVRQEQALRASIPRLTPISDKTSLAVREQYEESPYPRWVRASPVGQSTTIEAYLHQKLPWMSLGNVPATGRVSILIAGCGTGQHPIETARRFKNAQVLAIDLSLASLAYAERKTRELGVKNIEYAQADILQLLTINRTFDVIETSGVLHHLSDPMAGWRVLLAMLRPGGFMRVGLYSKLAREDLAPARNLIAQCGYGPTPSEIRRCRQELVGRTGERSIAKVCEWADFFSTSSCRDLLFHVEEHQMTLSEIDTFLRLSQVQFLGFDLPEGVLHSFRQRFADDVKMANLSQWDTFEMENPSVFANMYQFWIRKPVSSWP